MLLLFSCYEDFVDKGTIFKDKGQSQEHHEKLLDYYSNNLKPEIKENVICLADVFFLISHFEQKGMHVFSINVWLAQVQTHTHLK